LKNLLLATAVLLLVACTGRKTYDHFEPTPLSGWERNDSLFFSVPRTDLPGIFAMEAGVRIDNTYPFMALTLIIEQKITPGNRTKADTLACKLIDNHGIALGQGINLYQYKFRVSNVKLNYGDSLTVIVRHDMKREILPGICDVGISLSRLSIEH